MRHVFCGTTVQTGPGLPLFNFSKSQAVRYPHPISVLSINDKLVTEAAAYTMHTRGLSGIEPAIDENLTTYARWDWKPRSATKRNELNVYITM
jgi:hypothetical protein